MLSVFCGERAFVQRTNRVAPLAYRVSSGKRAWTKRPTLCIMGAKRT